MQLRVPPRRGSNPGTAKPEADMLPSEPVRRADFIIKYNISELKSRELYQSGINANTLKDGVH